MNSNTKKALQAGMIMLCTLLLSQSASASSITFTLAQPSQTGAAGTTLNFFGTITNTDISTVFLNSDNFTVPNAVLSLSDAPFFALPASLAPSGSVGDSTGLVDIFDVTIAANAAAGTYTGNFFQILGGSTNTSSNLLRTVQFTVTVPPASPVPEPNTLVVLASGLAAIASKKLIRRRRCWLHPHS